MLIEERRDDIGLELARISAGPRSLLAKLALIVGRTLRPGDDDPRWD